MDRDNENGDTSVTGGILRAVGTGMLIVCLALAGKAVFGGAGMAVEHLLTAAAAGVVGTMAMVGAAAADRECRGPDDAEPAKPGQVVGAVMPVSPGPVVGVAEVEASERYERRFTARLERESRQGAGRGV
jgi:hypothetical protein